MGELTLTHTVPRPLCGIVIIHTLNLSASSGSATEPGHSRSPFQEAGQPREQIFSLGCSDGSLKISSDGPENKGTSRVPRTSRLYRGKCMLRAKETTHCSAREFQVCTLEYGVMEGNKAERIYLPKALGFLDEKNKEHEVVRVPQRSHTDLSLLPLCP